MTLMSKVAVQLNEFRHSANTKAKKVISQIDLKIQRLLKSTAQFVEKANKPIENLKSKVVVQKEEGASGCCEAGAGATRGCCWA